jgi:hypothetical protein
VGPPIVYKLQAGGPAHSLQATSSQENYFNFFLELWDLIGYNKFRRTHMKDNKDYTRRNRFNGETVELTKEEAEKHDKIFYHEAMATLEDQKLGTGASKHWQEMRKLLDWFMKNNAKAYMVLLD